MIQSNVAKTKGESQEGSEIFNSKFKWQPGSSVPPFKTITLKRWRKKY